VPYLLGIPRYRIGAAVRGTARMVQPLLTRRQPARTFENELAWWDLAGFIYGKHVHRG
jgi:hypothetical protein